MKLDFYHNKIVADTITAEFEDAFRKELVPILDKKYGVILEIQMYEDYISLGFSDSGYWYYPLTLLIGDGVVTQWVRWPLTKGNFEDDIPYTFVGRDKVGFEIVDEAPHCFAEKIEGRSVYCSGEGVKVRVDVVGGDSVRLSGKYSQTFIDEMSRQLTSAIESATGVTGVADSSVELVIVFAPGTFMEHTSENVTYRRLMLQDKVSAPRDFWIQWTRLDGAVAHSVSSHVNAENILFELGEDVDQKIREKEYRYLLTSGKDKYHNAMGRKKVTEWRDVIKRAARRGELCKIESDFELTPETLELEERIADLLGKRPADRGGYEKEEIPFISNDDEFERAMEKMRLVVDHGTEESEVAETPLYDIVTESVEEASEEEELLVLENEISEEEMEEEIEEEPEEKIEEDEPTEEAVDISIPVEETTVEELEEPAPEVVESVSAMSLIDALYSYEEDEVEFEQIEIPESVESGELEFDPQAAEESDSDSEELDEETIFKDAEASKDTLSVFDNIIDEIASQPCEDVALETEQNIFDIASAEDNSEAAEEISDDVTEEGETLTLGDSDEEFKAEAVVETAKEVVEEVVEEVSEEKDKETVMEPVFVKSVATPIADRAASLRAEIETKIRLEYETRARAKAEQELVALRREQQKLKLENEAILAEAKKEQERLRLEYEHLLHLTQRAEAQREAEEEQRRAEEEQLRAQIEAQLRAEAKERERLAEAARMAIEEQHRLEAENARIARQRAEEERIEAEKRRRIEEEKPLEELRQAELARIRQEEEEAKARARAAMPEMGDGKYSYTSKSVKLLFRKSVDPNITTRIYEIMKATVEYYGKDRVYLKIRATVADSQTVILDFEHIPMEEMELLGNIIKILGNSGLGIAKAIVE